MRRPSFWRSQNLSIGSCRCLLFVIPEGDLRLFLHLPLPSRLSSRRDLHMPLLLPYPPLSRLDPALIRVPVVALPPRPPVPVLIPKDANPGPHHGDLRPPRHHRRPRLRPLRHRLRRPPPPHPIAAASHSSEPSSPCRLPPLHRPSPPLQLPPPRPLLHPPPPSPSPPTSTPSSTSAAARRSSGPGGPHISLLRCGFLSLH